MGCCEGCIGARNAVVVPAGPPAAPPPAAAAAVPVPAAPPALIAVAGFQQNAHLTTVAVNYGPFVHPAAVPLVGVGLHAQGALLYSDSFSPCIPVVIFRAAPAQTTVYHVNAPGSMPLLAAALAAGGGNPQEVVVIARAQCRLYFAQKLQALSALLQQAALGLPNTVFVWAQVPIPSAMIRILADGGPGAGAGRTIAVHFH